MCVCLLVNNILVSIDFKLKSYMGLPSSNNHKVHYCITNRVATHSYVPPPISIYVVHVPCLEKPTLCNHKQGCGTS